MPKSVRGSPPSHSSNSLNSVGDGYLIDVSPEWLRRRRLQNELISFRRSGLAGPPAALQKVSQNAYEQFPVANTDRSTRYNLQKWPWNGLEAKLKLPAGNESLYF
jgi:hypothetical protein